MVGDDRQKVRRALAGLSSIVLVMGFTSVAAVPEFAVTAVAAGPCVGVDGALTTNDPLMPWSGNGGYDTKHYDIDLTFTPATSGTGATPASIDAVTTITAAATGGPLCSFGLDLLGLTVTSVTVDGVDATFTRIQDASTDMYKLVVYPVTPLYGSFTVTVAYNGQPQLYNFRGSSTFPSGWIPNRTITLGGTTYPADGGGVGLGEPTGAFAWYPVNAAVYDKASYTTHLTVPNDMQAVAIGALQSKMSVGTGQTRWTWDEPDPVTSYLTIAAIGHYAHFADMHTTPGGTIVPIDVYVDAALDGATAGHAHYIDLLKQLLDWGEANFGPYQPAVAGYIMKSIAVNYALEIYGKPFYTSDWGDSTFIHEFAHQWFGDAVTTASWADLWLNEGFATYVPWLWYEDHGGLSVNQQAMNTYNNSSPTASLWSVAPAAMTSQSQLFGDWNYTGGGLALAALRQGIGPDLMDLVVKQWYATHAGGSGTTAEFIALAEQFSGTDLTQWAHDWLYTTGKPAAWPAALEYLPSSGMRQFTESPDMTGDGRGEVLAVDAAGALWLYPGTATGALSSPVKLGSGFADRSIAAPGDIDGDGRADVLAIDKAGDLWLYPGNGTKTLSSSRWVGNGWTGWRLIPAGDLTGDGKPDLLGIDSVGDLYMYAGKGNGLFATKVKVGNGWNGWNLYAAGDLNGDGKTDILGIDSSGDLFQYAGKGNGTFATKVKAGNGWLGYTLAAGADLNGDGLADITGRDDTSRILYYYRGLGGAKFAMKVKIAFGW